MRDKLCLVTYLNFDGIIREVFQIINGKPTLTEDESLEFDHNTSIATLTIRKRVNGKMKIIATKKEKL